MMIKHANRAFAMKETVIINASGLLILSTCYFIAKQEQKIIDHAKLFNILNFFIVFIYKFVELVGKNLTSKSLSLHFLCVFLCVKYKKCCILFCFKKKYRMVV